MASLRRSLILLSTSLAMLVTTAVAAQPTPERLLVGKWRHVSSGHTLDGKQSPIRPSETHAIGEFTVDKKWSLVSPKNRSSGTYKWLDGERLEQTVLESGIPKQIGMVSVKRVRVTADRLEFITTHTREEIETAMPTVKPGERRPNEMVITTVFSRVVKE
jgi:hypothetical protein